MSFADFLLDPQLQASIEWSKPLAVQSTVIPMAITGKSLVVRSRTGSGKTAAFLLPTIHRIITGQAERALLLAPTHELCQQIYAVARGITKNMRQISLEYLLSEQPNPSAAVCVCTPSCLPLLASRNRYFDIVVIDEADLCIALNPLNDLSRVVKPTNRQVILVSATLDEPCINAIRKKIGGTLRLVHVSQKESLPTNLCQFWIDCSSGGAGEHDEEKFVLLVSLIKLNILYPGPILIFSSNTNRSYRIRLVLEQFGLPACSLNSELPQESRQHTLERFQQGLFDILITTDRADVSPRGIDFRPINFVINFDLPDDSATYIHRVGRTARLDRDGTAISLVGPRDLEHLDRLVNEVTGEIKAYPFPADQVEGFRYRVREAMRAASKLAIRQARFRELRMEILNSEKLKSYFMQHERDYELLCSHGSPLLDGQLTKRFRNTPSYILPNKATIRPEKPKSRRRRYPTKRINRTGIKSINVIKSVAKGARLLKQHK